MVAVVVAVVGALGRNTVAETLENYAALLHKIGRGAEADKLKARAKAVRAKYE